MHTRSSSRRALAAGWSVHPGGPSWAHSSDSRGQHSFATRKGFVDSIFNRLCIGCVSHTLKECVGYHTPISNLGPVSPQNRAKGHFRSKPSRDSHIFSRKNPVKPLEYCQKRHISDLFFSIFPPVRELFFPPKMNVTPHF